MYSKKRAALMLTAGIVMGFIIAPVVAGATQRVFDRTFNLDGNAWDRYDDPDFQVKCWQYDGGYDGGISCIPWSEIKER